MPIRRTTAAVLLALAATTACAPRANTTPPPGATPAPTKDPVYEKEIQDWHARRIERLKSPGNWLSLVGLFWLKEGGNRVGSDERNEIVLPKSAPSEVGTLMLTGGKVSFAAAIGVTPTLNGNPVIRLDRVKTDGEEKPDKIQIGSITFHVIQRGQRVGVRATDTNAPTRKAFTTIETYPVDPKMRIEATWVPFEKAQTIEIATVIPGLTEKYPSHGEAVFTLEGKEHRLRPVVEEGSPDLFLIFGDATNGPETYGAGRFVYVKPPQDGKITLDFNKAYNPPCAFTPYATCPLPPDENRLPVRIPAGEKNYKGGHG